MNSGITRGKTVPSYRGLLCIFLLVCGSVQSFVPCASAIKLATVFGACFSKNWQVIRPIDVSMTTVGPLGWIIAAAVACGASGSAGSNGFGLSCANAVAVATAIARVEANKLVLNLMPDSRVNHPMGWLPAPAIGHVCLCNELYTSEKLPWTLRHPGVRSFVPWDRTCARCSAGRQGARRNRQRQGGAKARRRQNRPPATAT